MNYVIVGIANCKFRFNHRPGNLYLGIRTGGVYSSSILLELRTEHAGPPIVITFLDKAPENVVTAESSTKISINMPIDCFDRFYKMLCEAVNDKKYTLKLTTAGKDNLTQADFDFIPVR